MQDIIVPSVMFAGLTVVFSLLIWFRYRARREMQETLRVALDKGQDLTPEIIDRLGHPKAAPDKDLRLGVIWLAIANRHDMMFSLDPFDTANPSHQTRAVTACC